MSARGSPMSVQKLFSALIALALLFAPAATSAVAAHSGVPDHQMQMMESGHCSSMPSSGHDKPDGHSCCSYAFLAMSVAPSAPSAENTPPTTAPVGLRPGLHLPCLGEIA